MLRVRTTTIVNAWNYYRLHGATQTIRHAFSELSKLKHTHPQRGLASRLGRELFETAERPQLSHDPLVSIIICNQDGISHLPSLCDALDLQRYRKFEVVFVDNASTDGSQDYILNRFPEAKIIRLDRNLGFSEASNVGFLESIGELVAVLNNDTVPQDSWLSELIAVLYARPQAACAVPKILFNRFFSKIRISCSDRVTLSGFHLLSSLDYPKVFVGNTELNDGVNLAIDDELTLLVPEQKRPVVFAFTSSKTFARIRVQRDHQVVATGDVSHIHPSYFEISNSWEDGVQWRRIINNAGSFERFMYEPADRGYGEIDAGQYEKTSRVEYLCGCAALLKRSALGRDVLFRNEFFAYFEDSELSIRLRRSGHEIIYAPRSVVLHTHSATANQNVALRSYLIARNRLLFRYLRTPKFLRRAILAQAVLSLPNKECCSTHPIVSAIRLFTLSRDPRRLAEKCTSPAIRDALRLVADLRPLTLARRRVCIYNDYWGTCGGGEAHALQFARHFLRNDIDLTLASRHAIDKGRLSRLFDIDLRRVVLLTNPQFNSTDTAQFDLFINSTYQSTLVSKAKHSIFVVSFPSRRASKSFRKSYFFAFNSEFTQGWCSRFWGPTKGMLIEPVAYEAHQPTQTCTRRNIILNVGRFSNRGHGKNQHLIAKAFIEVVTKHPGTDWSLVLAGTLDHTIRADVAYYRELVTLCTGYPISLIEGAPREDISALYAEAKVYVHAAGLGVNPLRHPELTEHFGMTVAEAISAGCFVIVHDSGNPPFLVQRCGFGATYGTESQLVECLRTAIDEFASGSYPNLFGGREGCGFTAEIFGRRLSAALDRVGFAR